MAGYTRQSAAEIVNGEVINASDFNDEFNELLAAFDSSTGHAHDGTAAEGPTIPLIALSTNNVTVEASTITMDIASTLVATVAAAGLTVVGSVAADTGSFSGNVSIDTVTIDTSLTSAAASITGTLTVDVINEDTSAAGVTIDSVLIKDDGVTAATLTGTTVVTDLINEMTSALGVTVDGVLLKDSEVSTDVINEGSTAAGVTIDSVILKDGGITVAAAVAMADNELQRASLVDAATKTTAVGNLGATQTFDMETTHSYTGTVDQALVVTLSNPPASPNMGVFVLTLTNGGAFVITWPASVVWDTDGATAPTLQAAGVDIIQLITTDAGTTWRGVRIWKAA